MQKVKQISVLSGKGGTGKTSLVAAFATLAQQPVIADCDVDAANLYIVLHPENYKEDVFISGHTAVIDYNTCTHCGLCMTYCRFDAIERRMENGFPKGKSPSTKSIVTAAAFVRVFARNMPLPWYRKTKAVGLLEITETEKWFMPALLREKRIREN